MYHQFNIQQLYVLSTQCIYVFCMDLRTNSHYFPRQHYLNGFYNRGLTLCSPVVTICTTNLTFNNSTFCPHSVFMCFVWISEQTAIISLYNINWLVCITKPQSAYCAVRSECLYVIQANFSLQNVTNVWRHSRAQLPLFARALSLYPQNVFRRKNHDRHTGHYQTCSFCQHFVPTTAAHSHLPYAADHMKKQKTGNVRIS